MYGRSDSADRRGDRLRGIPNLDQLPEATMVGSAPADHSNRVRATVPSADRDARDAEVIAVGGWIERRPSPASGSTGRGRKVASAQQPEVSWYVVPDSALSQ